MLSVINCIPILTRLKFEMNGKYVLIYIDIKIYYLIPIVRKMNECTTYSINKHFHIYYNFILVVYFV